MDMPYIGKKHRSAAWTLQKLRLLKSASVGFIKVHAEEFREGRMGENIRAKRAGDSSDISWAQLLEARARKMPDKPFLLYRNETVTYRQMDERANQIAHFLLGLGYGKGKGLGICMRNSPRFLDIFFGIQKIGMYLVPINPELKGDGLAYLVSHSDIEGIVLDAELQEQVDAIKDRVGHLKHVIVNDIEEEAKPFQIPEHRLLLSEAYSKPSHNPGVGHNREDMCLIMYTSGTTGRPKGVVSRYKKTNVRLLSLVAHVLLKPDDVYYTYLALCHGNALFVTTTLSLARGATVALSRKFSASRFWDRVNTYGATVFNTIGSIIPILMKQPEKPSDAMNNVRFVISAACPSDMWDAFEKRFGTTIYEIYSAVDSGGKAIMNLKTAPAGSLGKPPRPDAIRIVDDEGHDVPAGMAGELLFKVKGGSGRVEYYKNQEASEKKSGSGWLHTGDLVRRDDMGFIYFVGRNTESMRKGGENVSAYEVEHVIMDHPLVEDVAVYAVPSELAEDDIMAAVKLVDGSTLAAKDLKRFLSDRLAKYAIPRYVRFVEEFPKTNSHRIMKHLLEKEGVTPDTVDTAATV